MVATSKKSAVTIVSWMQLKISAVPYSQICTCRTTEEEEEEEKEEQIYKTVNRKKKVPATFVK